jgi:choice-of-anchor A domain-containing protein
VLAGNSYGEPILAGNFSTNSDTDGRIAVFGNLTNTGAPIGSNLAGNPYTDTYTAIINGSSLNQNPYQVNGVAYVGGSGSAQAQGTSATVTNPTQLDFDFAAARTSLENYSVNVLTSSSLNQVNLLAAPVPDPNKGNGYVINIASPSVPGPVYVNLNPAYLTGNNGLFINYNPNKVTAVIFNVAGNTITTGNSSLTINGQQLGINYGGIPILFNFPTATTVSIGGTFTSSILAPFATLTSSANVSGTLIVGALGTTAETHNDYFNGTGLAAVTATPEPLTFALLGSGLFAIGAWGRKHRNKK